MKSCGMAVRKRRSLYSILVLFPALTTATSALQFDSTFRPSLSVSNGCVAAWTATSGAVAATPCHDGPNGWGCASITPDGISFARSTNSVPSPLGFPDSETGLVSHVFIAAESNGAHFGMTLLDAPCPIRIFPSGDGPAHHFATSSVLSSLALSIDFFPETSFATGAHIYEIEMAEACPLRDIYLGGSPASPAWNRGWDGTIAEAIFVSPLATDEELAAIRSYLSLKLGIGSPPTCSSEKSAILRAMGIRTGNLYGTRLLVR